MRSSRRVQRLNRQAAEGGKGVRLRLLEALRAEVPAARRVGALGLGRLSEGPDRAQLEDLLQVERVESVRLALAVASVRCGGSEQSAVDCLSRSARVGAQQSLHKWTEELQGILCSDPAVLRARLDEEPGKGRELILQLCGHQWPEDKARIRMVRRATGRRGEHACLEATGRLGCPSLRSSLVDGLDELHVDPGRGIAHRRLSGEALGRLGLPEGFRPLRRALRAESSLLGAPGAGMGVQYPVRNALLWAVGELQDRRAVPLLIGWLGAEAESPLGGLHLPAMEALWKLGEVAIPALEAVASTAEGPASDNAARVIAAHRA